MGTTIASFDILIAAQVLKFVFLAVPIVLLAFYFSDSNPYNV